MAEVSLRNVTKTFGGRRGIPAVKSMSLDIADGSFTVLVGPSGCGKTTTLRLIAGLEHASGGTISLGNRVVNNVAPKDRNVAMVFQDSALYPHMTARRNIAFGLKLRRIVKPEIDRRIAQAASMLGIAHLLDRKPDSLSGGERQRVALGRAMVHQPSVFLFDEPFANLDARLRLNMRAELKLLHQRLKTTTIHVTHDQEEAMSLGDVIVVMWQGQIQQVGSPLEIYRSPANRFVASFIGSPPMNFLDGMLVEDSGRLWFEEDLSNSNSPEAGPGAATNRIPLDSSNASKFANFIGKPIVLGVRPQALQITSATCADIGPTLQLTVLLCEPLGDQIDVICSTPRHSNVVARIPVSLTQKLPRPGDLVRFMIDSSRLHFFESGEFGKNLLARSRP